MARTDINNFISTTKTELINYIDRKYHYNEEVKTHNINIRHLNELQKNGDIIIKKADKSNNLIIMNKSDYTTKATEQLDDNRHYEVILNKTITDITTNVINEYDRIKFKITHSNLSKDEKQQLIKNTRPYASSTKFPKIYFNPKTHKENIPLRPIISGINWATEQVAILLDEFLKPLVYAHQHIPKDTFAFLKIIEKEQYSLLSEEHNKLFLLTFDVVALYTNIPNEEATKRVTKLLTNNQINNPILNKIPPQVFTEITKYLLNNNFFTFQNKIFRQKQGIAMGTPAGGSIANTYMIEWDKTIKSSKYQPFIHTYARYYDDGFMIWNGPEDQLKKFITYMNTVDSNIQTTANYGKTIIYLDIDIKLTDHNIILTRTHRKATASETYLDYRSSHPKHLKDNLPVSIFTRSFLLCNKQSTFNLEKEKIKQRFKNSHFPSRVIEAALNKTITKNNIPTIDNQPSYIESRRKALDLIGNNAVETNRHTNDIYLPVTFWPYLPIKKQFSKPTWASKLPNCRVKFKKPIISFKQPPNILRLLTNANT